MKKRYIVCLGNSIKVQDEAFIAYIKEYGLGWWHWLSNVWLIVDSNGKLSAREIRDKLRLIYPGEHTIVLELSENGDTWSGFGPKSEERNMFEWLKTNW